MKNITVFLVLVTIYLLTIFPVFGLEQKSFSFSVSPQIGFAYGQALEYVYRNPDIYNTSDLLSELKWDIKPVFYAGVQVDFKKTGIADAFGFFTTVSFKAGIPGDTGFIENRDWQDKTHSNLSDYSKHTNKTHDFFYTDISIGVFFPDYLFYFYPFITGSWMHFSFSGRDGYGEYPPGTTPVNYSGKTIITYKQDWLLASIGITLGTKILYPFIIDFSFRMSPFTYCISFDEHLTRNMTFKDYTRYGLYFEPGLFISYTWKKIDFCLDFNYRYIGKTRGVSYINGSTTADPFNEVGAGLNLLDTRFLVKFKF